MRKAKSIYRFSFLSISLLFGLFLLVPGQIYSQQAGLKYLKNYSRTEYDQHPQNWAILQDQRGIIYIGNNGSVIEFDGISWRPIYVSDNKPARSLAIDATGTIYVGSTDEIGFLEPQPQGSLKYVSLRKHIHDDKLRFSHVRRIHATSQGIYFRAEECLLHWDSQRLTVRKPQALFDSSFVCSGIFYIRDKGRGLLQMTGESLTLVPDGRTFADAEIFMMAPYEDQRVLIATRSKGCFLYNGEKVSPFPTEVDDYLEEKKLYHGIRLSSGDYALATLWGGLVIVDARGRLKQIFDKKNGLQDDNVKYVYEDVQGNLWLGLSYGISRIEYASPFSLYDERADLPKMMVSVVRHRKDLYVATNSGIYVLETPSQKFRPLPGGRNYSWDLLSTNDSLLAATSAGVIRVENGTIGKITTESSYVLLRSKKNKNRIWVGTGQGLDSLYLKNSRWIKEFEIKKKIELQIGTIVEDPEGNLWLGFSFTGGVIKIDFPIQSRQPGIIRYGTSHGLPPGEIRVFWAAGHVMFASNDGIYRYDKANGRFLPDFTLGNEFTKANSFVFRIIEDKNKNIWVHSKSWNYRAVLQENNTYKINDIPFLRLPRVQMNAIYPDGNTVWFGSHDNLIGFDST
ncbi:MAG: hypothetical protein JSV88_07030, partial [Candidatus Aminicenantes bacterium]